MAMNTTNKNELNNDKQILQKKAILKKILTQVSKEGGITYNLSSNKDYGGTKNIAVSLLPEKTESFVGKATMERLTNYCDKNSDLFIKYKKLSLGVGFDTKSGKTDLDITATIPLEKKSEAIALAKKANQKSIFDLYTFTETEVGGTGIYDPLIVTTTPEERLDEALILMGN